MALDDDAREASGHESDGSEGEPGGKEGSRSKAHRDGEQPLSEPRPWVHPSEFRRFVDLHAPELPTQLSTADQARRSAIAMAAMGFLIAGLLLLTGGSRPPTVATAQLTFTPHPSLLAHFASAGRSDGSKGARITSFFANEANDSLFKVGDVIVGCDHAPIANATALTACLHQHCIDERVDFEVVRSTEIRHVKVKLESGP
jgi:hypothetical protein